jgi:hypothetical protein
MNLIEISNQLKDVPDQFLMKEVQAPSGAYPSYLVISELTRRKRMRESALKEAPTTTVAQDLADPGREQRQMAMAQAAQQMAAPSLNAAGLAAAPQAMESLAAQDAMGTTPPEMMMPAQGMAAGGVVSFKQGGDIQRFQTGGQPLPRSQLERYSEPASSMSELLGKLIPSVGYSEDTLFLDPVSKEPITYQQYVDRFYQRTKAQPTAQAVAPTVSSSSSAPATAPTAPASAPSAPAAPAIAPFTMAPYKPRAIPTPTLPTAPTKQDLETAALTRQARYEEDVPFRLGYLEKEMADRAKEMAGRKESNINEALIQAGLGIMGSKSPRFLQAVSEGGTAGLRAYQQGTKDIRASEDLLRQSKIDYNKAQMLYDQGKFNEGDKAKQQSIDEYKRGIERANTEDAMVTRRIATEGQERANYIADARLGLELSERPARLGLLQAQTDEARIRAKALEQGKPPTFEELTFARAEAARRLGIDKVDPKDKAQRQRIDQEAANVLRSMNRAYSPTQTEPLDRGIQR